MWTKNPCCPKLPRMLQFSSDQILPAKLFYPYTNPSAILTAFTQFKSDRVAFYIVQTH